MTTLSYGSATDVGRVRSQNEDRFLVLPTSDLYAVADGMGGHQGGEVASAMAVEILAERAGEPSLEDLKEAARAANRAIFEKAGTDADLLHMGTTLCAVRIVPGPEGDEIAWVNVGDSRIYLLRDDRLIQLSRDHSLVEELVRDGQLTPEEAAVHPRRNIVTRALGIDVDVDVDGATVLPFTGDRFLLASDGLFGEISNDQITSVLRRLADPTEAAEELVRQANESGGRDNITVVVVEVVDDGGRARSASAALSADPTTAIPVVAEEPRTVPAADDQVFAGRRSSLPEADDDYGAEKDDLFGDLDKARSKRFTWRVAVFLLALLAVAGVVVGVVWYQTNQLYYVGVKDDHVAIYQGKPGGVLFFDPVLVEEFDTVVLDELPPNRVDPLRAGVEQDSETDARVYVSELFDATAAADEPEATTTTTAPVTTTTAPGVPTTTTPPTTTTSVP